MPDLGTRQASEGSVHGSKRTLLSHHKYYSLLLGASYCTSAVGPLLSHWAAVLATMHPFIHGFRCEAAQVSNYSCCAVLPSPCHERYPAVVKRCIRRLSHVAQLKLDQGTSQDLRHHSDLRCWSLRSGGHRSRLKIKALAFRSLCDVARCY